MKGLTFISIMAAFGFLIATTGLSNTAKAAELSSFYGDNVAQSSTAAVVKKRYALMKGISKTRKALRKAAKAGKIGPKQVAQAEKIAALAKQLTGIWPKGSGGVANKSHAKAEIWKDWPDFKKRLAKAQKASLDGVAAAKAGNAKGVSVAMKAMSCGGCHKRYRMPKKKK